MIDLEAFLAQLDDLAARAQTRADNEANEFTQQFYRGEQNAYYVAANKLRQAIE